jgi:hypothetical protein
VENKTLQMLIQDAIEEAKILEYAREHYEQDHMLYVAQRLSGAPYSFVKEVYQKSA